MIYSKKRKTDKLKITIISLIEELSLNIHAGKDFYKYILQSFAKIYRNEIKPNVDHIYLYLQLLPSILCETGNLQKPKNYFSYDGENCIFNIDLK